MVLFYGVDWYTEFKNLVFPLPLAIAPIDIFVVVHGLVASADVVDEVVPNVVADNDAPS